MGDNYGAEEEEDDANLVKLPQMPTKVEKGKTLTADKDKIEVDTIKKLVASYFNIVRKQVTNKANRGFHSDFWLVEGAAFACPYTTAAAQAPPNDAPTLSTRSPSSEPPVKTLTSDPKPSVYSYIVRKQMMDYVPKTVMAFLVKGITDGLQGELVSRLYSDATVEQMGVEAPETAEERVEMQESRESLMKALRIVEDVRQMGGHGHGHGH